MKKYVGFIVFLLSFHSHAESTSSSLFLRAMVIEKTEVEIKLTDSGPVAKIRSNSPRKKALSKFVISKKQDNYLVSVTHP